jgi:hypothetical protein
LAVIKKAMFTIPSLRLLREELHLS